MSVPLPAEVGETSSIGRVGYDWPCAAAQTPAASAPLARNAKRRGDFAMPVFSSIFVVWMPFPRLRAGISRKYLRRRPLWSMAWNYTNRGHSLIMRETRSRKERSHALLPERQRPHPLRGGRL